MKVILFTSAIFSTLFFGTTPTVSTDTVTGSISETGKEIFTNDCASCHTGGFKGWVSGAPDIDDAEDWEKALKKGAAKLTKNVFEGTTRHEAKGGCETCTEEEIKAAVEYIITKTKK